MKKQANNNNKNMNFPQELSSVLNAPSSGIIEPWQNILHLKYGVCLPQWGLLVKQKCWVIQYTFEIYEIYMYKYLMKMSTLYISKNAFKESHHILPQVSWNTSYNQSIGCIIFT